MALSGPRVQPAATTAPIFSGLKNAADWLSIKTAFRCIFCFGSPPAFHTSSAGDNDRPTQGLPMKMIAMLVAATVLAVAAGTALAGPVVVTETTSGSTGNWTYDFTFTNNVGGGQYLYYLGIYDPLEHISGTPSNFNTYKKISVGPQTYNLTWLGSEHLFGSNSNTIASGSSEGGFDVHDTSISAMKSFDFFGYTSAGGTIYAGGQNYGGNPSNNPVFVGTTETVPEPANWALMMLGVAGLGSALRFRRRRSGLATWA